MSLNNVASSRIRRSRDRLRLRSLRRQTAGQTVRHRRVDPHLDDVANTLGVNVEMDRLQIRAATDELTGLPARLLQQDWHGAPDARLLERRLSFRQHRLKPREAIGLLVIVDLRRLRRGCTGTRAVLERVRLRVADRARQR